MKVGLRTLSLTLGTTFLCIGCANIGPPEPPSLELPKPPSDLQATRKGDKVTLTWTVPSATTDRQLLRTVGPTRICRVLQSELTQCGPAVGETPARSAERKSGQKLTDSYADSLPAAAETDNPAAVATYAVEALNSEKRGAGVSNLARVSLVHTLPAPTDFTAKLTSAGVVLNWTGQTPTPAEGFHYVYRAYRHIEGNAENVLVGEVATEAQCCSLTDSNFEWEKTYEYHVQSVTQLAQTSKTAIEVPGEDSRPMLVFADDIFPPAVPSGLQAAFSGPGQQPFMDLIWAPDTDADLAGYNIYRREENGPIAILNAELVKTAAYRDSRVSPGKAYFYAVSAVDLRGNESARSEEASESVPER